MIHLNETHARASTSIRNRFRGCLLGGAVGDALGAPVEFLSRKAILQRFGEGGIRDYVEAYGRLGAITDDTQMTLFTAEGLIRSYVRWSSRGICSVPGVVANAYLRWLKTQGVSHVDQDHALDGWLIEVPDLHHRRAPGNTCVSALTAMRSQKAAVNQSKGCGGVMRVAPVGMFLAGGLQEGALGRANIDAFELGIELAALTHGHPTGQLASGLFADIVANVLLGTSLRDAIDQGLVRLRTHPNHEETSVIIERACAIADEPGPHDRIPAELGQGWIAEEALAIGIFTALVATDFEAAIVLAVNHDGDSDSTGSIAGNLLGAIHGEQAIPPRWLDDLELREEIIHIAEDLAAMWFWDLDDDDEQAAVWERYPGA